MRTSHTKFSIRNSLHIGTLLLTGTWISGLLAGVYILHERPSSALMNSVLFARVSIIGFLISLAFPILLSYILMRCFNSYWILPIVFLKALIFMCCFGSIVIIYRNAGWLASGMLLFSDFFLVVLLLYFWFRALSEKGFVAVSTILLYVLASFLIGCFDYFFVSPYVTMLFNC